MKPKAIKAWILTRNGRPVLRRNWWNDQCYDVFSTAAGANQVRLHKKERAVRVRITRC